VDGYAKVAKAHFDLSPLQAALQALAAAADRFYADRAAGRFAQRQANEALRKASRPLVALNYARCGRFEQDPAVTLPPVPLVSIAGDLESFDHATIGFALAGLLRGMNRAIALCETATAAFSEAG
jgi:hypothetical protein